MATKKKTIPKKAAAKKAAPKKKAAAAAAARTLTAAAPMQVNVTFRLGRGSITAKVLKTSGQGDEQTISRTGALTLANVQAGDIVSINGACAGTAEISASRVTIPASDPAAPLKFSKTININLDVQ